MFACPLVSTEVESDVTIAKGFGENTSEREPSKSISALIEAGGAGVETTVGGIGAGTEAPAVGAHAAEKDMIYNGNTQIRTQSYTLK